MTKIEDVQARAREAMAEMVTTDGFQIGLFEAQKALSALTATGLRIVDAAEDDRRTAELVIRGMRRAQSIVINATRIPNGAREPTRDAVVILGERIADLIEQEIDALDPYQRARATAQEGQE